MKTLNEIVRESVDIEVIKSIMYATDVDWEMSLQEDKLTYTNTWKLHKKIRDVLNQYRISSQISLLEAELERKKGMLVDEHPVDCIDGETPVETYGYEAEYNKPIRIDITYLESEIKKIKELI